MANRTCLNPYKKKTCLDYIDTRYIGKNGSNFKETQT